MVRSGFCAFFRIFFVEHFTKKGLATFLFSSGDKFGLYRVLSPQFLCGKNFLGLLVTPEN